MTKIQGKLTPWLLWETSATWIPSFQAVPETASCSRRMTSTDSREKVPVSPLTGRRNLSPLSQRKTNTNLPVSRRMHPAPPTKRRNHKIPVEGTLGLKKSSPRGKCSSSARKQPDNHDAKDHCSSSKHKDMSCSDKSSRCSSDKESSNTHHKCALSPPPNACSMEHPWKGPCVDEPSHVPGESSCASYQSPSRSMSELKDHGSFNAPTILSTPNKLWTKLHPQTSSTDSRLLTMLLDMGLYNSFSYYGPLVLAEAGPLPQ